MNGKLTRRESILLFGGTALFAQKATPPPLAHGVPSSPERTALIKSFQEKSAGIEKLFEARTHKRDWEMPYRLFKPAGTQKVPLILYLHGSGGSGIDNQRQLGLGNIFGTRVWALPANQKRFPCYVLAPQTDRGWARYEAPAEGGVAKLVPGFGDGAQMAVELVQALCRELPIDQRRIYVTGQSMGGAGVWNVLANRPQMFAAAVPVCGSATLDNAAIAAKIPLWNFHGDADETVPVTVSRDRIAAIRKAGGHPLSTEYAGVGHNSWEWAFTEPALVDWLFKQNGSA